MKTPTLVIAWTTVSEQEDALRLSRTAIQQRLAACAQIDGPIVSVYTWSGKTEESREYRVAFKTMEDRLQELEALIVGEHPYETPEFVAVQVTRSSEKYLNWVRQSST
jgi:periplasmic divalent cation tolerance protein